MPRGIKHRYGNRSVPERQYRRKYAAQNKIYSVKWTPSIPIPRVANDQSNHNQYSRLMLPYWFIPTHAAKILAFQRALTAISPRPQPHLGVATQFTVARESAILDVERAKSIVLTLRHACDKSVPGTLRCRWCICAAIKIEATKSQSIGV